VIRNGNDGNEAPLSGIGITSNIVLLCYMKGTTMPLRLCSLALAILPPFPPAESECIPHKGNNAVAHVSIWLHFLFRNTKGKGATMTQVFLRNAS